MLAANVWSERGGSIVLRMSSTSSSVLRSANTIECGIKDSTSPLAILPSPFSILMPRSVLQNQMAESFESIINSCRFFSLIILFLDVFKTHCRRFVCVGFFHPKLTLPCHCRFKGPTRKVFTRVCSRTGHQERWKYILWCFMQANRARLSVYPQQVLMFFYRCVMSWC